MLQDKKKKGPKWSKLKGSSCEICKNCRNCPNYSRVMRQFAIRQSVTTAMTIVVVIVLIPVMNWIMEQEKQQNLVANGGTIEGITIQTSGSTVEPEPEETTPKETVEPEPEPDEETKKGLEITTKREVIMYEEPNDSSNIVTIVNPEATLTNVEVAGNGWLTASYTNGQECYRGSIYYLYTNFAENIEAEEVIYENGKEGVITGDYVNFREAPGITTIVKDCLRQGTELQIISINNLLEGEDYGWYYAKTKNGDTGYIYAQYVTLEEYENLEVAPEDMVVPNEETTMLKTAFVEANVENYSDSDVELLAQVMTQEAGGCGIEEMGYAGQVLINRTNINGTDFVTELSKDNQYPTTWSLITSGQVTATEEARTLARQLLSGEVNGFEGSPVPEEDWGKVYFQCERKEGHTYFFSGYHYYSR